MKRIFYIVCLIISAFTSFGQDTIFGPPPVGYEIPKIVPRGKANNVVNDDRLQARINFYPPRYPDTSYANIVTNLAIDSCGALIFTYDINNFWVRACSPKRWVRVSQDIQLPDGTYSGGDVIYSGVGYEYIVTAATYVLNHILYTTPQSTIILDPSDPVFNRIDAIGLGTAGPKKITGVATANPYEPTESPLTFIRRSIVTVAANTTQPAVNQLLIYDEGDGLPGEWDITPIPDVDFFDGDFPYHGIRSAFANINYSDTLSFTNGDTVSTGNRNTIVAFVRLGGEFPIDVDLNFQLFRDGVPVSGLVPFSTHGLNRSIINSYQAVAAFFPEFGPTNIIFNEVKIIPTGVSDIPAFRADYIQIQNGLVPVYQLQNVFTSITTTDGQTVTADNPYTQLNLVSAGGLFVYGDNANKNITISGIGLIRNDFLYGFPQPTSAVSVDGYIKITNPSPNNNILDIQGTRGSIGLAQFIDNNPSGNGPNGGYFIHPITRFLAPNMSDGHATSIYVGKSYTLYGTMILQYMLKNASLGAKGVGAGISFFGTADVPFFFWADSSFVIGNHDTKNDRYKLDVPNGMARFNGAEIRNYTTQGGTVNDSSYVWKALMDSSINAAILSGAGLGNIGSGYRVLLPATGYKTLFGENGVQIDSSSHSNALTFQVDSLLYTTRLRSLKMADSLATVLGATNINANVGSFYRWVVAGTRNNKTAAGINGILIDSTSNTNALTFQVDSTIYKTLAASNKTTDSLVAIIAGANNNSNVGAGVGLAIAATRNIRSIVAGANITIDDSNPNQITIASTAGSPGTLTMFSFTNANGITGNVTNSTTTPTLTLGTNLSASGIVYSTGSAFAVNTNFVWDNTNQRFRVGATAATSAYANFNPSTTLQASVNFGSGGTAPTTPNNGDAWIASNHLIVRLGGISYQLDQQSSSIIINSTPITSGTSGRLLFQSGANLVTQSANLFWDNVNNRLQINGAAVSAALSLPASTTGQAPLNLGNAGTAPSVPNNADVWVAANHLMTRLNGVTYQLDQQTLALTVNSTTVGGGTSGRIFFQNAANQLSQSANLFWDNTNGRLQIGGVTAVAALGLPAGSTARASINFGDAGVAPTTPNNGDAWISSNNLFIRLGGVTVQLSNPPGAGVTSAIGTPNQVNVSSATGNVTFSLPQSIATTSAVQFQRLTVGGANALPSFIMTAATDPTAAAGVIANNGSRIAISFATTFKRFVVTNDVAPANGAMPIGNGVDYTSAVPAAGNNTLVVAVGAGAWSIRPNSTFQTLTDGASVIWNANNGYNAIWNVGGTGRALSISNPVNGTIYNVKLINTTGTATVTTWPSGTIWPSGVAPTLPAVAGAIMYVSLTYDGTNYGGAFNPNRFQ